MTEKSYKPVNLFFTCTLPEGGEDPDKCPIILIHGFFSTNLSWYGLQHNLSTKSRRKVYCIAMRNHGRSEYSDEMTIYHVVADLENFMISQHIPKAIFVGHSMGGRVSMAFALRKPEMVEKLLVEDMAVTDTDGHREKIKKLFTLVKFASRLLQNAPATITESELQKKVQEVMKRVFPEAVDHISAANKTLLAPVKKDKSGKFKLDFNVDAMHQFEKNIQSFSIDLSTNPQYFGKTLFMAGSKSPVKVETQSGLMAKHFPNYQVYIFEGGFHTLHIEIPDIFLEKVLNFIEDKPV